MMELKKQQARAPKRQGPSARQILDQKLAITDGQVADGWRLTAYGMKEGYLLRPSEPLAVRRKPGAVRRGYQGQSPV